MLFRNQFVCALDFYSGTRVSSASFQRYFVQVHSMNLALRFLNVDSFSDLRTSSSCFGIIEDLALLAVRLKRFRGRSGRLMLILEAMSRSWRSRSLLVSVQTPICLSQLTLPAQLRRSCPLPWTHFMMRRPTMPLPPHPKCRPFHSQQSFLPDCLHCCCERGPVWLIQRH